MSADIPWQYMGPCEVSRMIIPSRDCWITQAIARSSVSPYLPRPGTWPRERKAMTARETMPVDFPMPEVQLPSDSCVERRNSSARSTARAAGVGTSGAAGGSAAAAAEASAAARRAAATD
jgi:hypothetical protein